jgi:hypothetical protein
LHLPHQLNKLIPTWRQQLAPRSKRLISLRSGSLRKRHLRQVYQELEKKITPGI